MRTPTFRSCLLLLALAALVGAPVPALAKAPVVVVVADYPGIGFNDPTPATPVGGNPGTTLGQQRLNAFQFAADTWAAKLDSNQAIYIVAYFDNLGPNVLGQAGPWSAFSDFGSVPPFPGPEFADTWYGSALADKRAGADLEPDGPDIVAIFSADFPFYLGLDGNHGAQNDLVTVLLHEFAHGLGFLNFVDVSTGENLGPPFQTDIYSHHTLDISTGKHWNEMSDAERQASALRFANVVWDGREVTKNTRRVLAPGSPFLSVDAPASLARQYQFGTAAFGGTLSAPGITAPVALVNDGAGASPSDGCEPLAPTSLAGTIAVVDRGACTFVVKAKNAQDAGALAVIVANNAAGAPPGLAGVDPTIVVPVVSVTQADGAAIKAQIPSGVIVSLGVDPHVLAGADADRHARLYAVNPVSPGSSISHYDTVASPNQLMEPAINPDLTHSVEPPQDLTLPLLHDIGWFADADTDGVTDSRDVCRATDTSPTIVLANGCDSGVPNITQQTGCSSLDVIHLCDGTVRKAQAYRSCIAVVTSALRFAHVLTPDQQRAIQACTAAPGTH